MSSSKKNPRVIRRERPNRTIRKRNYREVALPFLIKDFAERCAYSMQHLSRAGGVKCMEVDHFDPTLEDSVRNVYENLFLATRHCNLSKRDLWPTLFERTQGMRFLNCCKEQDYGVHIKEDADSHYLVGLTPAGRYHILACDLNSPHLIEERKLRAKLLDLLSRRRMNLKPCVRFQDAQIAVNELRRIVGRMIPSIPYTEK